MTQLVKIAGWSTGTCVNVVFVHGLGGNAYDTWRQGTDANTFWPVWLAHDVPGLTAWALAYEASPTNWLGTAMPIQDRAKNVLERLLGERELRGHPLVFVCHSLGGLLIKQVLRAADGRRAYGDPEATSFLNWVKGVVFLATPHSGSMQASLLDKLRLIAWPSTSTIDLIKNNPNLRDLNIWYRNWSDAIHHKVFYEKGETPIGVIVGDDSSDPGLLHVDPIAIDADHIQICKPSDTNDLVYARTRDFVLNEVVHDRKLAESYGTFLLNELPSLPRVRSPRFMQILLRVAVLVVAGFVMFKGIEDIFFPPDVLGRASSEEIQVALLAKSSKWTPIQADQFIQALKEARGDPSFGRAVDEAKKGNTLVAEGIWRQIYEDRKFEQQRAQKDRAEAARNLAAIAVFNDVAKGLSLYREATALDPSNMAGWLGLGYAAVTSGRLEEADQAFQQRISLARDEGNEREEAVGLNGIADVRLVQDNLSAALDAYDTSLAIMLRLVKTSPEDHDLQRGLSISYRHVGTVKLSQDDFTGALKSYTESLDIMNRLTQESPDNIGWQRDLAVSYSEVGDVQVEQHDPIGALKSYSAALTIVDRLAKHEPTSSARLADLAVAYEKIGNAHAAQDDTLTALKFYRESSAIREKLAKMDPNNTSWQRDLAVSYSKISAVYLRSSDKEHALAPLGKGQQIMDRLTKLAPDNAVWKRDEAWFADQIAALQNGDSQKRVPPTSALVPQRGGAGDLSR